MLLERLAKLQNRCHESCCALGLLVHASQALSSTYGVLRAHHVQRFMQIIPESLLVRLHGPRNVLHEKWLEIRTVPGQEGTYGFTKTQH